MTVAAGVPVGQDKFLAGRSEHSMPSDLEHRNRLIAVHAGARALLASTRSALTQLGYQLVAVDSEPGDDSSRPSLRIVDERNLSQVPAYHNEPGTPIVLLMGLRSRTPVNRSDDPRIIGRVTQPAALTPLYGLLQAGLEEYPRRVPRVTTRLPARWSRRSRSSTGAVVSLSEGGCLLRTSEKGIGVGTQVELDFSLPAAGQLSLAALCIHGRGADLGLRFRDAPCDARQAIGGFVSDALAAS